MRRFYYITLFVLCFFSVRGQTGEPSWKLDYDSAQIFWENDWQKTIQFLTRAETVAFNDLGIYDENYLTIVNDLGLAYAQVKDYKNAERLLTKNLAIKTEMNAPPDAALLRSMSNLAAIHSSQGHFSKAEELYKKTLAAVSPDADATLYWAVVKNLLILYETNDRLVNALQLLEGSKSTYTRTDGDPVIQYELEIALGRINRKLRNYDASGAILEALISAARKNMEGTSLQLYVRALQEVSVLGIETGMYSHAEKNLLEALQVLKAVTPVNSSLLAGILNDLGSVYEKLGINETAIGYYSDALDLCRTLQEKDPVTEWTLESNIAGIHLKQGKLEEAIDSYEKIVTKIKPGSPSLASFYVTVLNNLATAYRKRNDDKKAAEVLDHAYLTLQQYQLDNDDLAATVMNNRGVLLVANGETVKAITFFERAYFIKKNIYGENSVLLMDLAGNLAVLYWQAGKHSQALPLFQRSIELAIRQIRYIFPSLSENEQIQFYKKLKEDLERFNTVAFLSATAKPELLKQVFDNQVTVKSLLFFTQQHRADLINEKKDAALVQQYELLKTKREQLGHFYQLSLKSVPGGAGGISVLEKEIDQLEKSISLKTSGNVAEKMMRLNITWDDIQKNIKPDEALIEVIRFRKYDFRRAAPNAVDRIRFGFTDSVYYAALVTTRETTGSPRVVLMKEGNNMETRFLNYYRNALTYNVPDRNSYLYYWKPFESDILGKTKIYMSGDGVYHRLNLNTLKAPGSDQYVLQRYDIRYLLNPAQFLEKDAEGFSSKKAVLVGDPAFDSGEAGQSRTYSEDFRRFSALPGTSTEVVKISRILQEHGWTCEVSLKKMATERHVKDIPAADIVHIATHGFFSTDRIKLSTEAKKDFLFYSGLVLAGANKSLDEEIPDMQDDGILTAYEVMNLDLSATRLVVLSACETGLGKIENGEGVYGLQRSFLQAGARNILISLWKVDDQITQELMVRFYEYLFKGHTGREALKLTQLDQLKVTDDPMHWGGFIMVGSD